MGPAQSAAPSENAHPLPHFSIAPPHRSCSPLRPTRTNDHNHHMGSLKKRRKAKIAKHKRKKRMKENRHKKRLRYKS